MTQDISSRIAEARAHQRLSLEQVAEKAQISVEELAALEANEGDFSEWPLTKATRLAEALDLNLSTLLGETFLHYDEWALIWSALIEYSANRPGLKMKADMKALIEKVKSFIPNQQMSEEHG
jgi:transcriptional regulator with XRE-family HTH domain